MRGKKQSTHVRQKCVKPALVTIWSVCPLCELPISKPQAGVYVRVSNGSLTAVHRTCSNTL